MSFLKRYGYLLLLSFFIGIGLVFLFQDAIVFQEGYFSIYSLERLQYIQIDERKLFLYVLQSRIKLILFLVVAGMIVGNIWITYLFSLWYGMSLGILAGIFMERFGGKGFLLFFGCILPQILFYLPGFYGILYICSNRRIYERSHFMIKCIVCIGVTIIGIFSESYVNPNLLSKIVIILKFL